MVEPVIILNQPPPNRPPFRRWLRAAVMSAVGRKDSNKKAGQHGKHFGVVEHAMIVGFNAGIQHPVAINARSTVVGAKRLHDHGAAIVKQAKKQKTAVSPLFQFAGATSWTSLKAMIERLRPVLDGGQTTAWIYENIACNSGGDMSETTGRAMVRANDYAYQFMRARIIAHPFEIIWENMQAFEKAQLDKWRPMHFRRLPALHYRTWCRLYLEWKFRANGRTPTFFLYKEDLPIRLAWGKYVQSHPRCCTPALMQETWTEYVLTYDECNFTYGQTVKNATGHVPSVGRQNPPLQSVPHRKSSQQCFPDWNGAIKKGRQCGPMARSLAETCF